MGKSTARRCLLVLVVSLGLTPHSGVAQEAEAGLRHLEKRFAIRILTTGAQFPVKTPHGDIGGKSASKRDVAFYARILRVELGLYPPALLKRAKLRRIVLCRELSFRGQKRAAVPDFGSDTLYLDVLRGRHSLGYVRKVIHHDFFHIVDWRDDGKLDHDEAWTALNPKGFRYGSGGANAQDDPSSSLLDDRLPGFLNKYSTSAVEEDKAEVYANMIVVPRVLQERAKRDKVLARKMQRMRQLLRTFCPEMNAEFWARVVRARSRK